MFALTAMIRPAPGKIADLKSVLIDWVEFRQTKGDRTGLQEVVWNSNGAQFGVTTLHESIAEAGDARTNIYAEPEYKTLVGKLSPLLGAAPAWSLWDVIVRPPNQTTAKFVIRVGLQSAIGRNRDVRQVMTDWCEYSHGKGNSIALAEEVWGTVGGRYSVRVPYDSLAAAEAGRAENNADPKYQQMAKDLSGLIDGPASWMLSESIISPLRREATNGAKAETTISA